MAEPQKCYYNQMNDSPAEQTDGHFQEGFWAVWRHISPFKNHLWWLLALGLISAATNGLVPFVTGRFFDALITLSVGAGESDQLLLWALPLGAWALIQIVANNVDWVMDRLRRNIDTAVHLGVQASGFKHLFRLPLSFHKEERINGVLEGLSNASWRVSAITRIIIGIAPQFLSILIGIALAATINAYAAGILISGVVLYSLLLSHILVPMASIDRAAHRAWNGGWNDAAASVHQIESVKQSVGEEYETKKVDKNLLNKARSLWDKLERNWSNIGFFQRIIVFFTQLAVFILSVHFISIKEISVGELVALNGYALMFFGPFVQLGHSWQTIQNGLTSAARAEKVFSVKEEIYAPQGSQVSKNLSGSVVFEGVSFRYAPQEPLVLDQIFFEVKPGESVALVGESGGGKSTIASLVSGYYFPHRGSVLIDGENTGKLNLVNLRKQIAVVPQEVALFNESIKENIRYGSFNATIAEVEEAAREAHIHEFIDSLPKKYATLVGERGIKLSVGQKQRVAIARAILRNPKILILDEPTSALDAETERAITASLERLMRGRTTFIIAHRLSTVRRADRILFLEEGRIAEEGSHAELMAIEGGKYRHLYELHVGLH